MATKRSRRAEADPESEAESSHAPKRARTSDESGEERPIPAREEARVDGDGSDLEDNEEFEEPEIPDEDEEKRFEEEHEAELREKVAQVKAQGVSRRPIPRSPLHQQIMSTEHCRNGYHRKDRDASVHVSQVSGVQFWSPNQLHYW